MITGGAIAAKEFEGKLWILADHYQHIVQAAYLGGVLEEREACAKVCDAECNPTPNEGHITTYQSGGYIMAEYLASAIRARGQS
jgi:hypothetical protein